ncbi:MAG: glycosyltransferase family 1 protein, partial [Anaerolineae bacterium]
ASRVGQNAEYICHRQTGLLVPPADPDAAARSLVDVLRRPSWQQLLGRAAAERVTRRFNWQTLILAAEAAYAA